MDYFGPHIFGYTIALLHSLGMIAAIHAVLNVRTAQGIDRLGACRWSLCRILTLIPYLIFGSSTFDGYIKARRQANVEMRKAVSELNWRPWVEEALTARASNAYDASLRAMPKLGSHAVPGEQRSALVDQWPQQPLIRFSKPSSQCERSRTDSVFYHPRRSPWPASAQLATKKSRRRRRDLPALRPHW